MSTYIAGSGAAGVDTDHVHALEAAAPACVALTVGDDGNLNSLQLHGNRATSASASPSSDEAISAGVVAVGGKGTRSNVVTSDVLSSCHHGDVVGGESSAGSVARVT